MSVQQGSVYSLSNSNVLFIFLFNSKIQELTRTGLSEKMSVHFWLAIYED